MNLHPAEADLLFDGLMDLAGGGTYEDYQDAWFAASYRDEEPTLERLGPEHERRRRAQALQLMARLDREYDVTGRSEERAAALVLARVRCACLAKEASDEAWDEARARHIDLCKRRRRAKPWWYVPDSDDPKSTNTQPESSKPETSEIEGSES